jgi:hypothetical protein
MATPKKPSGWNSLTKAQQEAWKKKNFNRSIKVTESQLDKLRKEGTPTKAIAKYKNDPAMREALNRFYGKDRVNKAIGSGSGTGTGSGSGTPGGPGSRTPGKLPKGSGPGNTRPNPKRGGPGAKTGFDGRMKTSPSKKKPGLSNQDKVMIGAGVAALGAAAIKGRGAGKPKAIGPGPIGRAQMNEAAAAKKAANAKRVAAGVKSRGKYAAPGKPVKTPLTRNAPGKYAAPKTGNLAKAARVVGKAGKFAGLNTPIGRTITLGSLVLGSIKPLDVKGNSKRKPPMGNPKKTTKK